MAQYKDVETIFFSFKFNFQAGNVYNQFGAGQIPPQPANAAAYPMVAVSLPSYSALQ